MICGSKHLYIPDTQVRAGVPINHFWWLAYYALDKGPNRIIWAGDHWDFPSLSSYDKKGSRSFEGRRLQRDVDAGHRAMEIVQRIWAREGWAPEQHFTTGNHENRFYRALDEDPATMEGRFPDDDPFQLHRYGIKRHRFLDAVTVDGVRYSHFFPHNARGQILQSKNGAPSAHEQVKRQMCSATAGHQQGLQTGMVETPHGLARGLIAGSFYLHNEPYIPGPQNYWRGVILKHNVRRGDYAICEVPMQFLEEKYRRMTPPGRKVA
jgi:hypothetical protein